MNGGISQEGTKKLERRWGLVLLFPLLLLSFSFQTSHETLVEAPPIRLRRRRRKLFYLLVLSVYMPHHALPVDPATASRAWLVVADGGARGISGNPRWGFRMTDGPERMADGVERRGRYSRSGRWFSASAATGCRNHILYLCVFSAFSPFSRTKIAIGSLRMRL